VEATILATLIYKRTHRGDPGPDGIFGIHDCMGQIRDWDFDSVIGIGGLNPDEGHEGIAERINWIGLGALRANAPAGMRGSLVWFKNFLLLDYDGPLLSEVAPKLFKYMFIDKHVRAVLSQSLGLEAQREIEAVIEKTSKSNSLTPSRGLHLPEPIEARRPCKCIWN